MKIIKPGFFVFILLFIMNCAHVQNTSTKKYFGDFEYSELFGAAAITGYLGSSTEIVVPNKINNLNVHRIMENAFSHKGLTSVIIPDGIYEIKGMAFAHNDLSSITLPDSLMDINNDIFISETYPDLFGYYVSSGKCAGTYTRQGNSWYLDNKKLPDYAILSSGEGVTFEMIDGIEADKYVNKGIYFIPCGIHTINIKYSSPYAKRIKTR